MLLFIFASLSVFLTLHDDPKNVLLLNEDRGFGPRSNGTEFASNKTFSSTCNKNLHLLFYPRMSLILCFFFFAFKLFSFFFLKCFWQFGYAKFHSLGEFKLVIIKPSA